MRLNENEILAFHFPWRLSWIANVTIKLGAQLVNLNVIINGAQGCLEIPQTSRSACRLLVLALLIPLLLTLALSSRITPAIELKLSVRRCD